MMICLEHFFISQSVYVNELLGLECQVVNDLFIEFIGSFSLSHRFFSFHYNYIQTTIEQEIEINTFSASKICARVVKKETTDVLIDHVATHRV